MRFPPNIKYLLFFLLALALIVLGTLYLPELIPGVGKVVIAIVIFVTALVSFFALFKPALGFLYARADGLLAVYTDANGKGFHVFAYHLNSTSRYGGSRTRDIQHYYIVIATGKLYYNCIYTHSMKPASGRSGWEGFISLEESVLNSPLFERSLQKLSKKAGITLQLAENIKPRAENNYIVDLDDKQAELSSFTSITDEGIKISCLDKKTHAVAWDKKI